MRIVYPLVVIMFGVGIGLLVNRMLSKSWLTSVMAAVIGGLSAIVGLITQSIFDFALTTDPLMDSLLASIGCAFVVSLIPHVSTLGTPPNWAD